MQTIVVEFEGREYTIDLTPTSVTSWLTSYKITGKRGAVGSLNVTNHAGTASVTGIERLARRKGKLTDALSGLVPDVKSRAEVAAQVRASISARTAAEVRKRARAKTVDERARRQRIAATIEPKRVSANERHLTLIDCQ